MSDVIPWPKELSVHTRTFDSDSISQLREIASALTAQTGAEYVAVVDESGYVTAKAGPESELHGDETGVLASAAFAATGALSARLGGNQVDELMQQSEGRSILIKSLAGNACLLIAFSKNVSPGMIRLAAAESAPRLNRILCFVDAGGDR